MPEAHVSSRRAWLAAAGALLVARPAVAQQRDSLGGRGEVGTLHYPTVVGRPADTAQAGRNNAAIQALEKRLKCPCPCGLDVYTCRTTDFTCTYSPESHRQVVAMWDQGLAAEQIIDAFVKEYGERALMAPPPRGFNLAGYLVPGALILLVGAVLTWVLLRRSRGGTAAMAGGAVPSNIDAPVVGGATAEELADLEREVAEDAE
ncbi:MAG TPA: cytochrome c-type biogenesis protein CcmH [Gemmatimonadales bacterium]|nr:cytochrome c-type biogenesis protein CcmH [Gemmatimonadales bacterium]